MDEGLAIPFASRLGQAVAPRVKVAVDGEALVEGTIYVVADPARHAVVDSWPEGTLRLVDREPVNGCRPSAAVLFASLARTAAAQAYGPVLSGGGVDGAAGLGAIKGAGGVVTAQSPETALVSEVIEAAQSKWVTSLARPPELASALLASR